MDVLFLASNPAATEAGTRYRVAQYFARMRAEGQRPTLSTFFTEHAHFQRTARGLVRRFADIASAKRYDLAFIYRELMPHAWNQALPLLRAPFVFDFDDSVFLPSQRGWRSLVAQPESTRRLVQAASVVFAGNDYLAEYARRFSQSVEVIPTVVDTSAYKPVSRAVQEVPLIGWIGSPTTARYLEPLLGVLDELAKDLRFRVRIVGAGRSIRLSNVEVESPPWHAVHEEALFQDLDIGVYPLSDDAWSRGKCGFKAIQYMACGVPCVVSPVGVAAQIVRDGVDGLWATSREQWRRALATLIQDVGLRGRMAAAGPLRIEAAYSLAAVAPRFMAGLARAGS